jgi:hypothetical protein
METSLHRDLKAIYAGDDLRQEVACDGYRIDAICRGQLIEVQHGSLAAIRDKVGNLLENHRVRVVKPLVARKLLIKRDKRQGEIISRRYSPKRCQWIHLFDELVYFVNLFPHKRLVLEAALIEVEEWRYPGHGRRRRRRDGDFQVEDQKLLRVVETRQFKRASDLCRLLPPGLPTTFHTGHLAEGLEIRRWMAQRMAYCLRKTGAIRVVGKEGNAILYRRQGRLAA